MGLLRKAMGLRRLKCVVRISIIDSHKLLQPYLNNSVSSNRTHILHVIGRYFPLMNNMAIQWGKYLFVVPWHPSHRQNPIYDTVLPMDLHKYHIVTETSHIKVDINIVIIKPSSHHYSNYYRDCGSSTEDRSNSALYYHTTQGSTTKVKLDPL